VLYLSLMSRFIDRLNQVSQAVPQTMGFKARQPASLKPKILLIASLAQVNVNNLVDYVAGADAGLLHISKASSGAKTLQKICQAVPDIPWGGWLQDSGKERVDQMVEVGFDFVVFPAASTSLAILQSDKLGRVLQVEASLTEGLLRAVDELPIDAVFVAGGQEEKHFLTWHHLMTFQRFADLLTKPLLASVPLDISANELLALWEAGVDGVVLGIGEVAGRLKELRQIIEQLSFPQRKRGRAEALLPRISVETGTVTEEEEEEE